MAEERNNNDTQPPQSPPPLPSNPNHNLPPYSNPNPNPNPPPESTSSLPCSNPQPPLGPQNPGRILQWVPVPNPRNRDPPQPNPFLPGLTTTTNSSSSRFLPRVARSRLGPQMPGTTNPRSRDRDPSPQQVGPTNLARFGLGPTSPPHPPRRATRSTRFVDPRVLLAKSYLDDFVARDNARFSEITRLMDEIVRMMEERATDFQNVEDAIQNLFIDEELVAEQFMDPYI